MLLRPPIGLDKMVLIVGGLYFGVKNSKNCNTGHRNNCLIIEVVLMWGFTEWAHLTIDYREILDYKCLQFNYIEFNYITSGVLSMQVPYCSKVMRMIVTETHPVYLPLGI